jgi:hypothetical protein
MAAWHGIWESENGINNRQSWRKIIWQRQREIMASKAAASAAGGSSNIAKIMAKMASESGGMAYQRHQRIASASASKASA